jgi:hypothetical protein
LEPFAGPGTFQLKLDNFVGARAGSIQMVYENLDKDCNGQLDNNDMKDLLSLQARRMDHRGDSSRKIHDNHNAGHRTTNVGTNAHWQVLHEDFGIGPKDFMH